MFDEIEFVRQIAQERKFLNDCQTHIPNILSIYPLLAKLVVLSIVQQPLPLPFLSSPIFV